MSRKSKTFGQLLRYVNAPESVGPAWLHNVKAQENDLDGIRREFFANAGCLKRRKNGNVLYHEILSFGQEDRESVTVPMMEDLVRRYLDLRAPYALAYARGHFNTECPHVHVVISANNVGSSRRLRLSRCDFRSIQREVERYQRERYPFLGHSVAQGGVKVKSRSLPASSRLHLSRGERERKRRGDRRSTRKEMVAGLVRAELAVATTGAECFRRLLKKGLRLYKRGKSAGVEDVENGRRYRLKTLGLAEVFESAQWQWQRAREALGSTGLRKGRRQVRGCGVDFGR